MSEQGGSKPEAQTDTARIAALEETVRCFEEALAKALRRIGALEKRLGANGELGQTTVTISDAVSTTLPAESDDMELRREKITEALDRAVRIKRMAESLGEDFGQAIAEILKELEEEFQESLDDDEKLRAINCEFSNLLNTPKIKWGFNNSLRKLPYKKEDKEALTELINLFIAEEGDSYELFGSEIDGLEYPAARRFIDSVELRYNTDNAVCVKVFHWGVKNAGEVVFRAGLETHSGFSSGLGA